MLPFWSCYNRHDNQPNRGTIDSSNELYWHKPSWTCGKHALGVKLSVKLAVCVFRPVCYYNKYEILLQSGMMICDDMKYVFHNGRLRKTDTNSHICGIAHTVLSTEFFELIMAWCVIYTSHNSFSGTLALIPPLLVSWIYWYIIHRFIDLARHHTTIYDSFSDEYRRNHTWAKDMNN